MIKFSLTHSFDRLALGVGLFWIRVFSKLSKLLGQEVALGAPCFKALSQYSCPIKVARCGFLGRKPRKASSLRSTPIAKLLRRCFVLSANALRKGVIRHCHT